MCGIAGEVFFDGSPISREWMRHAGETLRHRGPDGDGTYAAPGVGLVHRRLSIIDVEGGRQPMSWAGERYWITFNGEIYNYEALRGELEGRGARFRTHSDTEVLLAAWEAWGLDALRRLSGIFAFGLWDRDTRSLLLARDPLGVKPLLFHESAGGIRFASECKALLAHPAVAPEVDAQGLRDYLTLGYVLGPRTIVAGVRKLEPGHYLFAQDGRVRRGAYWDLAAVMRASDGGEGARSRGTDQERIEAFDACLDAAVHRQMVSDVPLGSFLSGGLDSSSIAYYAQRHARGALQTFSMGFDEASFSETAYAREVASHLGTSHHEGTATGKTLDELRDLVWYYDEPLGDTSIVPTWDLAGLARRHVKVALSGDGCDEILAGYDTYVADLFQRAYARLPASLHRGIVRPLTSLIPATDRKVALDFKIRQFVLHAHAGPERAHFGWRTMFDDDDVCALAGQRTAGASDPFDAYVRHYDAVRSAPPLDQSLYVDVKTWLVDDILTKVDRATMACGLEARVPFLDVAVVEAAMRLPGRLKLRRLERKVALRRIMSGRLPDSILSRKKRGFNAPVTRWLRGRLREDVSDLFASRASTLVDLGAPALQSLWREHLDGRADHGFKLWTILCLGLWEERVLNGRSRAGATATSTVPVAAAPGAA
ncbi:MAG: asparagine synthase (glutamine-hydrolyzing) [Deltaproteobacteria bacterium]|nr:asparagine synthase (glutamine-hydrolyzing) [Deltaproteobacteria bacterium]